MFTKDACEFIQQLSYPKEVIWDEIMRYSPPHDLPIDMNKVKPYIGLVILVWLLLGPLLSIIMTPGIGIIFFQETLGM